MTPYETKAALLASCGYDTPATAPARVHHDAAIAINAALQALWSAPGAPDFATQTLTFSTVGGTPTYELPVTIQPFGRSVRDVVCNSRALIECTARRAFDFRANLYTGTFTETTPRFYHVSRDYAGAGSTAAEARTVTLRLGPTPAGVLTVTYRATLEPPQYSACDLEVNTGAIPMPESKIPSFLIPLAGWHMLRSYYLQSPPVRRALEDAGKLVMAQIGLDASAGTPEAEPQREEVAA